MVNRWDMASTFVSHRDYEVGSNGAARSPMEDSRHSTSFYHTYMPVVSPVSVHTRLSARTLHIPAVEISSSRLSTADPFTRSHTQSSANNAGRRTIPLMHIRHFLLFNTAWIHINFLCLLSLVYISIMRANIYTFLFRFFKDHLV